MNGSFSWYPGHIAKAKRQFSERWMPLLDLIIEVVDARLPITSCLVNRELIAGKPHFPVYNKADVADLKALAKISKDAIVIEARRNTSTKKALEKRVLQLGAPCIEALRLQGRQRKLRVGICGLPNVGKSTLINALLGKAKTKTGDKPGVTRQMQFVGSPSLAFDLLDSPGLLPLSFEPEGALKLALVGVLPQERFAEEVLAIALLALLEARGIAGLDVIAKRPFTQLLRSFQAGQFGLFCLDDSGLWENVRTRLAEEGHGFSPNKAEQA